MLLVYRPVQGVQKVLLSVRFVRAIRKPVLPIPTLRRIPAVLSEVFPYLIVVAIEKVLIFFPKFLGELAMPTL